MDFLIIAEPNDQLAHKLCEDCKEDGLSVEMMDLEETSCIMSIDITNGQPIISPNIPLFFRVQGPSETYDDFNKEFLYGEYLALVWSIAALSPCNVINRPGFWGLYGKITSSPYVNEVRAGINERCEIYVNKLTSYQSIPSLFWAVETNTQKTFPVSEIPVPNPEPLRIRPSFKDPGYEQILVVENKAWNLSELELKHLKLKEKSISICRRLQLVFSVIVWYIDANFQVAKIACINPFPELCHVAKCWNEVRTSLMEALIS